MEGIKNRRKIIGISQRDLAMQVGVSVLTIQFWENGTINPGPNNREKLEQVLIALEDEKLGELQDAQKNREK